MPSRPTLALPSCPRRACVALGGFALVAVALLAASCGKGPATAAPEFTELAPGLGYANERLTNVPWSIHVVRVDRADPAFEIHSVHASKGALGLSTLSEQLQQILPALGIPVAAVNGDFYQRDRAYAGDPRGLQVVDGELLSAPVGGTAFWTDAAKQPHTADIISRFQLTWSDGTTTPFGLNEDRQPDAAVLYTPAIGASTHTIGGRELVLDAAVPLRINADLSAKVQEARETGDTALRPGSMVLSIGPQLAKTLPKVAVGATLRLSTATSPGLRDIRAALSGGPVLVRNGKAQKIIPPPSESYSSSSMTERHPRSAIGWDQRYLYLVEVDGRQDKLSVGMTLEELASYLAQLGCTEAMNLDGGGSSTFWVRGQVMNSPCYGSERAMANALVLVQKPKTPGAASPAVSPP